MTLYFEKLETQVEKMGVTLADRNTSVAEQTRLAGDILAQMNNNEEIWRQIMIARENDAGFRGAAPLPGPDSERLNVAYPLPDCPRAATIFASDGSQIYPDQHGPAPYWLTNIGVFIYHHALPDSDKLPEILVEPLLYFEDKDVRDAEGRLIPNSVINARRNVYEMQMLSGVVNRAAETAARPLLALYDGPLIGMPMGKEIPNSNMLTADYHEAMDFLFDVEAALAGYIDRPSSRFMVYTIYLMTLEPEEVTRNQLQSALLEGLDDSDLYAALLGPGERSGLMVQQSPLNKEYKDRYGDHQEIVFFYLNTASKGQDPYLARVEIPMWVAARKALVEAVHSLIYSQCQITDRYPYALTRADEVAVVHPVEKRELDERIAIELLRNRQTVESSQKLNTKGMARYGRQQYDGV